MLIYGWVAMVLLNNMRITFTNSTQTVLTDIKIDGCEPAQIDKLDPGATKTIWVGITGDCSINIYYLKNGQAQREEVAGYVTTNMGQKMNYNIGGQNAGLF